MPNSLKANSEKYERLDKLEIELLHTRKGQKLKKTIG
jgi:hypothetical protein